MLRVVASSCKLFCSARERTQEASHDDFTSQVVSAVSEVFNNIAIHGYAERTSGNVEIEIEMDDAAQMRGFQRRRDVPADG